MRYVTHPPTHPTHPPNPIQAYPPKPMQAKPPTSFSYLPTHPPTHSLQGEWQRALLLLEEMVNKKGVPPSTQSYNGPYLPICLFNPPPPPPSNPQHLILTASFSSSPIADSNRLVLLHLFNHPPTHLLTPYSRYESLRDRRTRRQSPGLPRRNDEEEENNPPTHPATYPPTYPPSNPQ